MDRYCRGTHASSCPFDHKLKSYQRMYCDECMIERNRYSHYIAYKKWFRKNAKTKKIFDNDDINHDPNYEYAIYAG